MMYDPLAPPKHPPFTGAPLEQRRAHLVAELTHRPPVPVPAWRRLSGPGSRTRRLVVVAVSLVLIATGVGTALAVGGGLFDERDAPARIGPSVDVAAAGDWTLTAWKSTRGICLGIVVAGEPASAGCGFPVVGAPPDTVVEQPEPTHVIGGIAGTYDGNEIYVAGPVAEHVTRVAIELRDGRVLDAPVNEAPLELEVDVDFFFLRTLRSDSSLPPRADIEALRAYGDDGTLLERFVFGSIADVPTLLYSSPLQRFVGSGRPAVLSDARLLVEAAAGDGTVARLFESPSTDGGRCEFVITAPAGSPPRPDSFGGGFCHVGPVPAEPQAATPPIQLHLSMQPKTQDNAAGWQAPILAGGIDPRLSAARVVLDWSGGSQELAFANDHFIVVFEALYEPPAEHLPYSIGVYDRSGRELARHQLPRDWLYIDDP